MDTSLHPLVIPGQRSPRRRLRPGLLVRCALALAAIGPMAVGCTSAQIDHGQSSSYLILQSLEGASGATPTQFGSFLDSDVQTLVKASGSSSQSSQTQLVPTVYDDPGQVTLVLALKDPGSSDSPTTPTSTNYITVTRYHVEYVRADGRNTPGVDVPYPFDGALSLTVSNAGGTGTLTLVRVQAKEEAPLEALVGGGGAEVISTIANVTFYGTDQAGRSVSVSGSISVNFADWADPQ